MPGINRIIALIDFSRYSPVMVQLCVRWSEVANAELVLVHRVPGLIPARATSVQKDSLVKAEEEEARAKLEELIKQFPTDRPVSFRTTHYNIVETVWEMTEEEGYNNFVVAGLKGTGMWKSLLLGGVTTHLINELEHTIIAVPEDLCQTGGGPCNLIPSRVVVLVKGQISLNDKALGNFLETFSGSIKEIVFLTVLTKRDSRKDAEASLSDLAARYNTRRKTSYQIFEGDALEEILNYVEDDTDTVLVTQKGSRTLTDRLFRKFFIHRLVEDGSMPMVVLPTQEDE